MYGNRKVGVPGQKSKSRYGSEFTQANCGHERYQRKRSGRVGRTFTFVESRNSTVSFTVKNSLGRECRFEKGKEVSRHYVLKHES